MRVYFEGMSLFACCRSRAVYETATIYMYVWMGESSFLSLSYVYVYSLNCSYLRPHLCCTCYDIHVHNIYFYVYTS